MKLIHARATIVLERPEPIAEIAIPDSMILPFIFDFERQEVVIGDAPTAFEAGDEITAELAGVTSYVADPD